MISFIRSDDYTIASIRIKEMEELQAVVVVSGVVVVVVAVVVAVIVVE